MLLIFDTLVYALCRIVVPMTVKIANEKLKKHKEKQQGKNFNLKTRYCFVEFCYKHSIHSSCDLPNFSFNYLINPQILNDARGTFFKC